MFSQVGIGTGAPASSALLELSTDSRGFLPPRLTTEQIKSIALPATGLMLYNLTTNKPCYFNATRWVYFDTSYVLPELGKFWGEGGGYVIWLDNSGLHGFIAAAADATSGAPYGCYGSNLPAAQGTAIGTGQPNTAFVSNVCGPGTAAKIADDFVSGGKSDWFLPSKDELNLIFLQRNSLPEISGSIYISSSQNNATTAWMQNLGDGTQVTISSTSLRYVRPMRAF